MNIRKKTRAKRRNQLSLSLVFSVLIFFSFLFTVLVAAAVALSLIEQDEQSLGSVRALANRWLPWIVPASVALGTALASLVSRIPLRPINEAISALNRLAAGDFGTRLHLTGWISRVPAMEELNESFNKMAQELENTELLRTDFINTFSHEFKTPIVSIAGFAALLKRSSLTTAQKMEYVDVIREESLRLSAMATNVLNLSKVENQTILRDVTVYNLSEQIRSCVLLLENKWSPKNLEMHLDFDEYRIAGSAEMLRQVWINLLDNAVKFTPDYGTVRVDIHRQDGKILVTVANTGSTIPKEQQERIFQKFYQAGPARALGGSGVGLAIVKKAVELHRGSVCVTSGSDATAFTVTLPAAF